MKKKVILKASCLLKNLIDDDNFKNARLLVFDENYHLIVSEIFGQVLFQTYKVLHEYDLIRWVTDYEKNDDDKINVIVAFVKKTSKGSK